MADEFQFEEKTGIIRHNGTVYVGCRVQPPGQDLIDWLSRDLARGGWTRQEATEICVAALNRTYGA